MEIVFVKLKKPLKITVFYIKFYFFYLLFELRKLQSNTITSYRCSLIKPMKLGFNLVYVQILLRVLVIFIAAASQLTMRTLLVPGYSS